MYARNVATLAYASPTTPLLRPTKHSWFAALSWLVFIGGVIFDKIVVAMAYHGSRTYPWDRFERNVGPLWMFEKIEWCIAVVGTLFGIAAVLHPFRKRWAAWLALICNVRMMLVWYFYAGDPIWMITTLLLCSGIGLTQLIYWLQSRKKPAYAIQID